VSMNMPLPASSPAHESGRALEALTRSNVLAISDDLGLAVDASHLKTVGLYPSADGKHPRGLLRELQYPGARRIATYGQERFGVTDTVRSLFAPTKEFGRCFGGVEGIPQPDMTLLCPDLTPAVRRGVRVAGP